MDKENMQAQPPLVEGRVDALVNHLTLLVQDKRVTYANGRALVEANVAKGLRRGHGKKRLCLTRDELVEHEKAREDARKAQRELMVLVPVLRLVIAAKQNGEFEGAKGDRPQLAAMRLASYAYEVTKRGQDAFERNLAQSVLRDFSDLLELPKPLKVEKHQVAQKTADPLAQVQAEKTALLEKIMSAVSLSAAELALLTRLFT